MSEAVKHAGESGTRRAQQARATRRRITDQAAKLFIEQGYAKGTRDKRDVSYQRPLDLDAAAERW